LHYFFYAAAVAVFSTELKLEFSDMTPNNNELTRAGKIKYGLAAWLLGLPVPIIIIALLWGGCTKW
jgi:hypothetical protein